MGKLPLVMTGVLLLMVCSAASVGVEGKDILRERFTVYAIGCVEKGKNGTRIVIDKAYEPGLLGLAADSHIHVLYWFDRNDTPEKRSTLRVHPRGNRNNPLRGVFATRAPVRPNLIALSLCRILAVRDNVIEIDQIDALPNSPVLDIKPYIPGVDVANRPREGSSPGWLSRLRFVPPVMGESA
jgi:tRNA-Thr(GGU) m(6)t(6)A37 methyltransferase TsaA